MDVLVLAAQKGGTGKTTICANLAVEAEACGHGPVALVDVDPQGTLSKWWNRRQASSPTLVEINVADIEPQLRSLKDNGVKLVIVDTPGAITSHVRTVIRAADMVIIPSRPSILDIEVIAHPGAQGTSPRSASWTAASTVAPRVFAVLTTERNAA
jgi:chromosome partitioning protein